MRMFLWRLGDLHAEEAAASLEVEQYNGFNFESGADMRTNSIYHICFQPCNLHTLDRLRHACCHGGRSHLSLMVNGGLPCKLAQTIKTSEHVTITGGWEVKEVRDLPLPTPVGHHK